MQHDWILDVLADLNSFARSNGLNALAEQLDDATLIAAAEIAGGSERSDAQIKADAGPPGHDPGGFGNHRSA